MSILTDAGIRIATPVCGLVRNDIGFDALSADFGAQVSGSSVIASQRSSWRGNPFFRNA
jgi:hypothetical protein